MKNYLSSVTPWIVIFLIVILLFMNYRQRETPEKISIGKWKTLGESGQIMTAVDAGGRISGEFTGEDGTTQKYQVEYVAPQAATVLEWADAHSIPYEAKVKSPIFTTLLFSFLLPVVIILALWMFLMRQLQGGGNKAMSFGKSKAKLVQEGEIKVTFKDVAGVEEAREELAEIVAYLKDPKKFSRLGGRIPKGVLLIGPPGTGKTLLAKAIAGEANVPFFSISGSDFVEMFVGVGASRVRDLFEQAKKAKPCIIFIDEIDAVGRSRFSGIGGSHDEREQTLNQLLVEMDGFADNEGVILISATNRPDVLDPALLRPGRFDRQVMVALPDIRGREQILTVHAEKVKIDDDADLSVIAKGTPGFSGADLANLINEAALLAARADKEIVSISELEEAKDRVMMGPERRSLVISEKEKIVTAYHEAGHALAARLTPGTEEVHKVTIIPRGPALGVTYILPSEDHYNMTRQQLENRLTYLMGGRAAEEIQFGEITTGASNDIERATDLARRMVCQYGMSEKLGPRSFGEPSGHVFLGKEMTRERNYSEETATIIDEEIKRLLGEAHEKTLDMLRENKDALDRVGEALIERETIDGNDLTLLVEGKPLPPLEPVKKPPTEPKAEDDTGEKESAAPDPKPRLDLGPQAQPS